MHDFLLPLYGEKNAIGSEMERKGEKGSGRNSACQDYIYPLHPASRQNMEF